VQNEDDVLHLRVLPNFNKKLSARDSELLISYLTVPYLRIPLLLRFFSTPERIGALADPFLQEVLDAAMFEPSLWQHKLKKMCPPEVPAPDREHLATPCGLLLNELVKSPEVLLNSLEAMLEMTLDMDTGRYDEKNGSLILFVVRLIVRVQGFVSYLVPSERRTNFTATRGLDILRPESKAFVSEKRARLQQRLDEDVFPMLEQWCAVAMKENHVKIACLTHAHICYIFKNNSDINISAPMNFRVVSALLSSQIFLCTRYRFDIEIEEQKIQKRSNKDVGFVNRALWIPQTELFDIFQNQRAMILNWLETNKSRRDEVLESVVRVVTYSGSRKKDQNSKSVQRTWESLTRERCHGRFVPATEKAQLRRVLSHEALDELSYEEWLRTTTTLSVDTEVNLQLSEFTLKKHKMKRIESSIEKHPDFEAIFGKQSAISGMQSAEVKNTKFRTWIRLVGRRHDVQMWTPDTRQQNVFPHDGLLVPYDSNDAIFESFRRRRFPAIEKWFLRQDDSNENHRTYIGLFAPHAKRVMEIEAVDPKKRTSSQKNELHDLERKMKNTPPQVKEIVVYVDGTIHVFNVTEHGRRYYRTIVYTNSSALCLRDFKVKLIYRGKAARPCLVGGDPRRYWTTRSSLLVTRNLNLELGPQLHIPARLLRGVVPCALLEKYIFWRSEVSGKIMGYLRKISKVERDTQIEIEIESKGTKDTSDAGLGLGVAKIRRFVVLEGMFSRRCRCLSSKRESVVLSLSLSMLARTSHTLSLSLIHTHTNSPTTGTSKPVFRGGFVGKIDNSVTPVKLVNLLNVSASLRSVRDVLTRMENLSHIFVWANEQNSIVAIELPRLRLSFEMRKERLYCNEHAGLFVSSPKKFVDADTRKLLTGIPHGLVLQNESGALFVLVPSATRPTRPPSRSTPLPTALLMERNNKIWLEGLGDTRHYLYPIHRSRQFLFATSLASSLYLLLLRLLARKYDSAFRLCTACTSDQPLSDEEAHIFDQLKYVANDPIADAVAVCCSSSFYFIYPHTHTLTHTLTPS